MMASRSTEMDDLVERTRGVQPLRRLFHALTGLSVAAALTWLDLSRGEALAILGVSLVALVTLDVVRLRVPRANLLFFRTFRSLVSPREARGVASSTWYAVGLILAVGLFPREAAVSGVLVLSLCDPVASYLGQRWGRRPFMGGSVEGTVAFFAAAVALLLLRHPAPVALGGAVVATLAERLAWPLDDNLVLPPVTAAAVAFVGWLL